MSPLSNNRVQRSGPNIWTAKTSQPDLKVFDSESGGGNGLLMRAPLCLGTRAHVGQFADKGKIAAMTLRQKIPPCAGEYMVGRYVNCAARMANFRVHGQIPSINRHRNHGAAIIKGRFASLPVPHGSLRAVSGHPHSWLEAARLRGRGTCAPRTRMHMRNFPTDYKGENSLYHMEENPFSRRS